MQCRRPGFDPWVWKIPRKRASQSILVLLLGESMDRGAWQVAVHRAAQSWTWLKWLSSSSSILWMAQRRLPRGEPGLHHMQPSTTKANWPTRPLLRPSCMVLWVFLVLTLAPTFASLELLSLITQIVFPWWKPGFSKLQSVGQIHPVACFCIDK